MDKLKTTAIGTCVAPVVAQVAVGGRHPGDRMMLNQISGLALLVMALPVDPKCRLKMARKLPAVIPRHRGSCGPIA